jgi:broad specificity phosphatase PhoE
VRLRHERISAAYCSDLQRASETARLAMGEREAPLIPTPALREMSFGEWEGLRAPEIAARFPEVWSRWVQDPSEVTPPGAPESLAGVQRRAVALYESLRSGAPADGEGSDLFTHGAAGREADLDDGTVLFVSHGGIIRSLLAHLMGLPLSLYWRFSIRPASLSILDIYPAGPIAEVIGETWHLAEPG